MSFLWVWIIFAGQIFKQISTMKNSQCQRWCIHIPMRTFYLELILFVVIIFIMKKDLIRTLTKLFSNKSRKYNCLGHCLNIERPPAVEYLCKRELW